jgi:hypothetical protein
MAEGRRARRGARRGLGVGGAAPVNPRRARGRQKEARECAKWGAADAPERFADAMRCAGQRGSGRAHVGGRVQEESGCCARRGQWGRRRRHEPAPAAPPPRQVLPSYRLLACMLVCLPACLPACPPGQPTGQPARQHGGGRPPRRAVAGRPDGANVESQTLSGGALRGGRRSSPVFRGRKASQEDKKWWPPPPPPSPLRRATPRRPGGRGGLQASRRGGRAAAYFQEHAVRTPSHAVLYTPSASTVSASSGAWADDGAARQEAASVGQGRRRHPTLCIGDRRRRACEGAARARGADAARGRRHDPSPQPPALAGALMRARMRRGAAHRRHGDQAEAEAPCKVAVRARRQAHEPRAAGRAAHGVRLRPLHGRPACRRRGGAGRRQPGRSLAMAYAVPLVRRRGTGGRTRRAAAGARLFGQRPRPRRTPAARVRHGCVATLTAPTLPARRTRAGWADGCGLGLAACMSTSPCR